MAKEQNTEPKPDEQDKQRLPARDEKSSEGKTGSDAPMDPEDAAFIKKNK
jgi:hypothetical protein